MDIMQPRKVDGEGTYFNSCHLTSETLNNRQAIFDVNNPTLAWAPPCDGRLSEHTEAEEAEEEEPRHLVDRPGNCQNE